MWFVHFSQIVIMLCTNFFGCLNDLYYLLEIIMPKLSKLYVLFIRNNYVRAWEDHYISNFKKNIFKLK